MSTQNERGDHGKKLIIDQLSLAEASISGLVRSVWWGFNIFKGDVRPIAVVILEPELGATFLDKEVIR